MKKKGMVYLVGAGPGDAGLLTMRGAEVLSRADVIVYDALVNPELLRLAPRGAEVIFGGKRAREHSMPQEELNKLLIARARAGKTVVRLKGGDPYVFGRGGEEAEEVSSANVGFEVIPGVSSFSAVPSYAGIPVTHREHSSAFTVITGHENPEKSSVNIDWATVARMPGTKVIMMATHTVGQLAGRLIEGGMTAETPVCMVSWGTTGRQRSIEGTLATIGDVAANADFRPPSIAVVGDVVKPRHKLQWFEKRPLFGKRVVVTRTRNQASQLSHQLAEAGADVLEIPTIKIEAPDDKQTLVESMAGLGEYDWLIFTSPNGVAQFFDYFFRTFEDVRDLGALRIAAVGPATAAKIREYHLKVDLMPTEFVSSKIAAEFKRFQSVENVRMLLLRAQVANPELTKALEDLGAIVDDVSVYKTVPETEDVSGAASRLMEEGAHWVTFASGSSVENFHARFNLPELLKKFPQMKLASIGPETSKTIRKLGLEPSVEAEPHTIEGLLNAVVSGTKQ